ncbi:MAG: DUF192 domain-containing protein [Actinomycetota bacterium]
MRPLLGVLLVVTLGATLGATGCSEQLRSGGAPASPGATPSASPTFDRGTAVIDTEEGSVIVNVELAATPAARAVGLMHRDSLPEDAGMVFVYFEPTRGGFYMKNTSIPLSIAFFDNDGVILKILDMEPCTADPCETYDPGVAYSGALEVNQGAFDTWGVEEGDVIHVS